MAGSHGREKEKVNIKNKANFLRQVHLERVLDRCEGIKDNYDSAKWHTCRGVITVNGAKFMNWNQGMGGGGAIDLVMHLKGCDFKGAIFWLLQHFSSSCNGVDFGACASKESACIGQNESNIFISPKRDDRRLPLVINYLRHQRFLPQGLIKYMIGSGRVYGDSKGNVVFLLLGKEKKAVGAELRGTTALKWHGMAPGSQKHLGAFYVKGPNPQKMVICESALDALSCFALHPHGMAISTSGVNANPAWLSVFIEKGFDIFCGFDSDEVGEAMAEKMITFYPFVKRLRPEKHDWNEVLKARLKGF